MYRCVYQWRTGCLVAEIQDQISDRKTIATTVCADTNQGRNIKDIKRDFSDMDMELTTEKEDERGQNKLKTAANERGQNNDRTAANSNQADENGEREQPASRHAQSRYGRQLRPPAYLRDYDTSMD